MDNYRVLLKNINTFFFDVDGVLTDGSFLIAENGEQMRTMNVKDGYAMQYAVKKGFRIVILSGGQSNTLKPRFEYLGIKDIFLGIQNKLEVFEEFIKTKNISLDQLLFMGDDIPDYEIMSRVVLPCCPADASEEIKSISKYISPRNGGKGCVRDVIEQTLKVQDCWFDKDSFHW